MTAIATSDRKSFGERLSQSIGEVEEILLRLLAISSENPPGDTAALASEIQSILSAVPGIDVELVTAVEPIVNVAAVIRGRGPGRRLVFNGHLDTFENGDVSAWSTNPFGERKAGYIYGRGAVDMKGGLAALIFAAMRLAEMREHWQGELVLILTGDEESAGPNGTQFLLETNALATGDAMMCADAGSPQVLRFGEKGSIWLTLEARGKGGHGAHAHLTISAVDRLIDAMTSLRAITTMELSATPEINAAIDSAAAVSEQHSGAGEAQILKSITVNFGTIHGGTTRNIVADQAEATADIRLPAGASLEQVNTEIATRLDGLPGISYRIDNQTGASVTDPGAEIVTRSIAVCSEVIGQRAVATMRVGASDSPLFRDRGIPAVVCGLTPLNMGAADEHVLIKELRQLAQIYALTGFDYLRDGAA
jgi:succinyl-diaminopimelate desuccinylase